MWANTTRAYLHYVWTMKPLTRTKCCLHVADRRCLFRKDSAFCSRFLQVSQVRLSALLLTVHSQVYISALIHAKSTSCHLFCQLNFLWKRIHGQVGNICCKKLVNLKCILADTYCFHSGFLGQASNTKQANER